MKKWALLLSAVLVIGLFVGMLAKGFGRNPREVPFGMKGKPAPAFTLQDLQTGETVSLESLAGKPVVINFWATWCGPCKLEHPNLEWAARNYGKDVHFLGMIFEDTPENARKFLAQYAANYRHLVDPHSLTAVKYGAAGVPETYFITRDGLIHDKYQGPIPRDVLNAHIRTLLADAAPPPGSRPGMTGVTGVTGVATP